MRKIFLSLMLIFGGLFLVACDEKKKLDLTVDEANKLLADVNTSAIIDDVISLKASFDIDVNLESDLTPEFKELWGDEFGNEFPQTTIIKGKGSFEAYANLKSYEEFLVVVKADVELTFGVAEDTEDMVFKANLYILDGNLYVDGKIGVTGAALDVKLKQSNVITEDMYNEFKESLVGGEEQAPLAFDLEDLENFELYKVSGGYLLETVLGIEDILTAFIGTTELPEGITETGKNKIAISLNFSDIIQKLSVKLDVNLELNIVSEPTIISGHIKGKASLDFNLKGTMPSTPSKDTLNAYPERSFDDILPNIPFF